MMTTLIGFLRGTSSLDHETGLVLLTTIGLSSALDPVGRPLPQVRELEGQIAIVEGVLSDGVLFDATIVEVLPPVASEVTRNLVEQGVISAADLGDRTLAALGRISGDPTAALLETAGGTNQTCALVVGHRPGARGAVNAAAGLTEFEFNDALAKQIADRTRKASVQIVHRDDDPNGYSKLPAKINALEPSFIVSLHCNAFNTRASGTEMLYFHRSTKGHRMALELQSQIVSTLGLSDRHTKKKTAADRGGLLLSKTRAPCVIAEPFFIDNNSDLEVAQRREKGLATAYAKAIDNIAKSVIS